MGSEGRTIVGHVVGDGPGVALARGRLRIGAEEHVRQLGRTLVLALDDGTRLTLAASPEEVVVAPPFERTAPWSELHDTPLARLFTDKAPGEHARVELTGFALEPDARIAVHARTEGDELVAVAIAIGDGDAAASTVVEQLAAEIAERSHAARERKRRAKQKKQAKEAKRRTRVPRPWKYTAPILLVPVAVLAAAVLTGSAARAEAEIVVEYLRITTAYATIAGLLLTIALAMRLSRPPFEAADTAGKSSTRPSWAIGKMSWLMLVCGLGTALLSRYAGLIFLAVAALGYLVWCVYRNRPQLRIARLLVFGSRAHPNPPAPGYGWFEGEIVTSSGKRAIARELDYIRETSTYDVTTYKDGVAHTSQRTNSWIEARGGASTLAPSRIHCGDTEITIAGSRTLWGAPIEYLPPAKNLRFQTRGQIANGDRVVVLARIHDEDGTPTIQARGAEALVMFGAPQHPRGVLRMLMRDWYANAAALLAVAAACIALVVHLAMHEPPGKRSAPAPVPAERG